MQDLCFWETLLNSLLIINSTFTLNFAWISFTKPSKESCANVQYFYDNYYNVPSVNNTSLNQIYEEYLDNQSLSVSVIPSDVHKETKVNEGEIVTVEHQHLTTELTFFGSVCLIFNVLRFTNLSKLEELFLSSSTLMPIWNIFSKLFKKTKLMHILH